jgi:hypothetical protein
VAHEATILLKTKQRANPSNPPGHPSNPGRNGLEPIGETLKPTARQAKIGFVFSLSLGTYTRSRRGPQPVFSTPNASIFDPGNLMICKGHCAQVAVL